MLDIVYAVKIFLELVWMAVLQYEINLYDLPTNLHAGWVLVTWK